MKKYDEPKMEIITLDEMITTVTDQSLEPDTGWGPLQG